MPENEKAESPFTRLRRTKRKSRTRPERRSFKDRSKGVEPTPTTPKEVPYLNGEVLESWGLHNRPKPATLPPSNEPKPLKVPEIKNIETENENSLEELEVVETVTKKRLKRKKLRAMSISISVSMEEAELLRLHAASKNRSLSAWAREVLFRSMGRKPPARNRQDLWIPQKRRNSKEI